MAGQVPSPPSPLELTEAQRQRAEANRLRALAKRKALLEQEQPLSLIDPTVGSRDEDPRWGLFKCRKLSSSHPFPSLSSELISLNPSTHLNPSLPENPKTERFRVRLEICSPDSFCVTPGQIQGFAYPGEAECFSRLEGWLFNVVPTHFTQDHTGVRASVYKLKDYEPVLKCLRNYKDIEIDEIPWKTYNAVERLSHSSISGQWTPCRPEHLSSEKVEELMSKLPMKLLKTLHPFQVDGLRFGLQRNGRCLIADEMGLGKTLQAIAIASCFQDEGSILVVCPAILRYQWAEELERWLPSCSPFDIHLVFGRKNDPANLARSPKIVVTSYAMLSRLRKSIMATEWAVMIVDESHQVRCRKAKAEVGEIKAVLDVATKAQHLILLSGTPSLSRPFDIYHQINMLWPGLLGTTKYEFAKTYCSVKVLRDSQGRIYKDYSQGCRLQELNVLLRQSVMIRRLKESLLVQLPPKRRQIVKISLKISDIRLAKHVLRKHDGTAAIGDENTEAPSDVSDKANESRGCMSSKKLSPQELGIAKVSGFLQWLSLHPVITETDVSNGDSNSSQKMIIFGHHHKVFDRIQEFICDKGIGFVRIDSNTQDIDRQTAVKSFQSSREIKVALIGIQVGYAGLNLSAAQSVVFVELPKEPTSLLQAEDRAHRQGQTNAVNVYIFCAMESIDETRWQRLNKSFYRVSSTTNGKYDAVPELMVDGFSYVADTKSMDATEYGIPQALAATSQEQLSHPHVLDSKNETNKMNGLLDGTQGKSDDVLEGKSYDQEHDEAVLAIEAKNLRFAVSQYTKRVHLFACTPEIDSRPRPLSVSFSPEEIVSDASDAKTCQFIKKNPTCWQALLLFFKQWNNLRSVDRRKLQGKTLQLPLIIELLYLNENPNHDDRGLLKGGSKRRFTPLCEVSRPLPPGAVWKQVHLGSDRKKKKVYEQAWTAMDEPLCKLCQEPCKSFSAKKPEFLEELFCNLSCYEEYRTRTNNGFLRRELFSLERGVCSICELDCHKLVDHLKKLPAAKREKYIKKVAPNLAKKKKLMDKLVVDPIEGNAWHADHLIPVYQGGGECRVDNLRTLCVACHAEVTAAQCAERKEARKLLRNALGKPEKRKHKRSLEVAANDDDEDDSLLLINVPGSAYSN